MIVLVGILALYILGSITTALTLGYRGYESGFCNDYPPAPLVIIFWPLALVIFGYLKLYDLGKSVRVKEERKALERKAQQTAEQVATKRPTYLGPAP